VVEGAVSDARAVVLARIRDALGPAPAVPGVPREYRGSRPADIDLFAERVAEYRATVHRTEAPSLADALAALLEGARRVAVPPGLAWQPTGVELVADEPPLSALDLDGVDAVLTGCALGIAETGTIVLDGTGASGRRALTLVPDRHICVVFAEQVVGGLPDAIAALDPSRPLTFVSGPSATSDIELERVEGVHGPRRLEVVLVQ
jgi:L-lactate dehydrogenase complex protein LldG